MVDSRLRPVLPLLGLTLALLAGPDARALPNTPAFVAWAQAQAEAKATAEAAQAAALATLGAENFADRYRRVDIVKARFGDAARRALLDKARRFREEAGKVIIGQDAVHAAL